MGEEDAWETLREKIVELEEKGAWREIGKETSMMKEVRLQKPKVMDVQIRVDGVESVKVVRNVMEAKNEHKDDVKEVKDVWEVGSARMLLMSGMSRRSGMVVGARRTSWRLSRMPRMSWKLEMGSGRMLLMSGMSRRSGIVVGTRRTSWRLSMVPRKSWKWEMRSRRMVMMSGIVRRSGTAV